MCASRYLGFVLLVWFPGVLHAQSTAQPCSAPRLNGGYLVPEQDTYPHETKLTYACDNGRKPAVEGWWATSTCLNGTWSHEPQCIDENACIPPNIPNAKYTENQSGWHKDGQTIRITCNDGYEPKDWDATAKCMNGTWSSVPICEKSIHACGEPPKIPHAVIIHQEYQEVFPADTNVEYVCKDGFTVEGADTKKSIYCIAGNWTEGPTCIRGTRPGAGQGGSAEVETAGTSAGSGTQPEADGSRPGTGHGGGTSGSGTQPTGGDRGTRPGTGHGGGTSGSGTQPTGGDRGTRPGTGHGGGTSGSGTQPTGGGTSTTSGSSDTRHITTVDWCGAYPTVPNGDVVKEDPMFLKYQCNAFYTHVGPNTVRCHSDGRWSQLPICKAAFCVLNPPQTNLRLSGVEYIKEGEQKFIPCIWKYYSSRVQCIDGRLFYSQCCEQYYHQHGRCP